MRTKDSEYPPTDYKSDVDLRDKEVVSYEELLQLVQNKELKKKFNVFDARALPRFEGNAPEPRPGLPSGHVPGAQPLPFINVLDKEWLTYPSTAEEMKAKLTEAFKELNDEFDPKKETICMCGTGVTGAIIKGALELADIPNVRLYDGSWTEWAIRVKDDRTLIAEGRD